MLSNDETPLSRPALDLDDFGAVMTIHSATFQKLARNPALNNQLADFFEDLAVTYMRMSRRLRCLGPPA